MHRFYVTVSRNCLFLTLDEKKIISEQKTEKIRPQINFEKFYRVYHRSLCWVYTILKRFLSKLTIVKVLEHILYLSGGCSSSRPNGDGQNCGYVSIISAEIG